jgi:hypothetical protein
MRRAAVGQREAHLAADDRCSLQRCASACARTTPATEHSSVIASAL